MMRVRLWSSGSGARRTSPRACSRSTIPDVVLWLIPRVRLTSVSVVGPLPTRQAMTLTCGPVRPALSASSAGFRKRSLRSARTRATTSSASAATARSRRRIPPPARAKDGPGTLTRAPSYLQYVVYDASYTTRLRERAMRFLPFVWSNLKRRKVRTVLTALSIFVAFVLFGLLMAIRSAFSYGAELAGADRLMMFHRVSFGQP